MEYDGIIFDKDGVLLDSMSDNYIWADRLRVREAGKKGFDLDMEDVREIIRAKSFEELKKVQKDTGLSLNDIRDLEITVAEKKIEKMKNGEITLFNSAEKVLTGIDAPKSVASNAPRIATDFTVKHFDIENHFEKILSPTLDDLEEYTRIKKPGASMLETAIDAMNAENPVMVGDSTDDIRAAKRAGIDSIHVRTNGGVEAEPTYTVEELEKVLEVLD